MLNCSSAKNCSRIRAIRSKTNSSNIATEKSGKGTGEDISIAELAYLVKNITGYKGDITFDSYKPDGTPRKLMDVNKLTGLGWRYSTGLANGIALAYKDFLKSAFVGQLA